MRKNKEHETITERTFIKPKISLQECKAILNKNGQKYADEEIIEIRNDLLVLIEIDYFYFLKCMQKEGEQNESKETEVKIIHLNADEANRIDEFRNAG